MQLLRIKMQSMMDGRLAAHHAINKKLAKDTRVVATKPRKNNQATNKNQNLMARIEI